MSYLDIDTRGLYSIHDISHAELNVIQMVLLDYRNLRNREIEGLSNRFGMYLSLQQNLLIKNGLDKVSNGEP